MAHFAILKRAPARRMYLLREQGCCMAFYNEAAGHVRSACQNIRRGQGALSNSEAKGSQEGLHIGLRRMR